jgi:cation diffusion facilitator family transporter
MSGQADSLKSILFALFANSAIAVAKGVAAMLTGSGAMLAEAVHSVADAGNQLLLILGLRQARKKPTDDHPLGFGKSIYFWSFLVAVILFSVGGMFSVYEGIHKLQHPEPLSYPWVAVGVLVFAIVAESISLWGCMREVNKERYGRSIVQWFRHSRHNPQGRKRQGSQGRKSQSKNQRVKDAAGIDFNDYIWGPQKVSL